MIEENSFTNLQFCENFSSNFVGSYIFQIFLIKVLLFPSFLPNIPPALPVDLGREGGWRGDDWVVEDVVLLCHDPGQILGHLGASLNNEM